MKYFTKEVRIALVAIVAVVLMFFGLNYLKGLNIFSHDSSYFLSFKDISGLSVSSPVYADGYKIGVVKSITYDYNHRGDIIVEISVDQNMRIPKGSSAELVSEVLGTVKVNLLLANNPSERVEVGDTIKGGINDGALGQMKNMLPAIEKMLPKLDSILSSVNTLLADPALKSSLHNVQGVTENLKTSTSELNTLLAGLNNQVPGMINRADATLDNVNVATKKLSSVDVEGTMAKVNGTLDNVQQLTARLNSNQGTLGLLMNDASLYNNLNSTMRNADSLMVNLRQHPKRYVHFSLFGKKDK
jgi:phospholipid/cholesterol/gamma-HCH transport system substrate-binding protein